MFWGLQAGSNPSLWTKLEFSGLQGASNPSRLSYKCSVWVLVSFHSNSENDSLNLTVCCVRPIPCTFYGIGLSCSRPGGLGHPTHYVEEVKGLPLPPLMIFSCHIHDVAHLVVLPWGCVLKLNRGHEFHLERNDG